MNISSDWKNKSLTQLSIEELAYAHLGGADSYQLKDGYLDSILPIICQEIRHSRNMNYSKNFVPVVSSFAVIEQIGFSYSRNDKLEYSNPCASPIKKAMYYFADYEEDDRDIEALYSLRNSFLHNASLMAKAKHTNQTSFYFQFDRSLNKLAEYPNFNWDGNIQNFEPETMTTLINPNYIIKMAFDIVEKALSCLEDNTLDVCIKDGKQELYYRFLKYRNLS
ncbi:hypothetical protein [Mastigocoleus sp. MO_188.B34]|uniref:hypothetical protein n=1 Tax=Mastigocoleus sp. MO_188.B34 TaxID=3036635 RepID=UPI002616C6BE|nr:hypothetical protein [Mastigocoleus sp. MO_188.B34]MDJ0695575.1 hypothetical protein [Mastigocoleus sp. MO_188.B34]